MRAHDQRILTGGGGHDTIARCLKIERKQLQDMRLVVDSENQFVCHMRLSLFR